MAGTTEVVTMPAITLRLPEAKHEPLKHLARSKNVIFNKLFEEWATVALVQEDVQSSYEISKARGNRQHGLDILDKLDQAFAK
jgi:hypothetical protein